MLNHPLFSKSTWGKSMVLTTKEIQQRMAKLSSNSSPLVVLIGWLDSALLEGDNVPFTNPENRKLIFEWVD
ncbi:MAG: hypothetical protein HON51_09685 [Gammaproteobacteria bacterium]|jgi:hypothetical protein|nr:hypothetical protein [Gammaproteobacteria bacterium]MBT6576474.1 hypothetical protein [Gammaproteobacteria bacterium]